jgi:hypothetical protein
MRMNKNLLLTSLLFSVLIISSCMSVNTNPMIIGCNPDYDKFYLVENIGHSLNSDEEVFGAFKDYSCVYDSKEGPWVEDCINSDMAAEQAVGTIIKEEENIILDDENVIENVWIYQTNKAFDNKGNLYYCEHLRLEQTEKYCASKGAGYTEFSNLCGDSCSYRRDVNSECICEKENVYCPEKFWKCDCGENECWNGYKCENINL